MTSNLILVTGATGYVGGRLIPQLLESGYQVRAMGRSVSKMASKPWGKHPRVDLCRGDVLDLESLRRATSGCHAAYYLVHSMIARKKQFDEADRQGAHHMVQAAEETGLKQIIYLGGLGDIEHHAISKHLKSRHEVGNILKSGSVPVTCLRAAMILGSGSASFEILRYLVEHLPVMITPRWVHTPCQPIAISNVLNYLQGCLEIDGTKDRTFDIGGPDILTYRNIIDIYAEEAHLHRRWVIPVPTLTPRLSAYWIHLVTPVPASIAIPLTEGLSTPVICRDHDIRALIPQTLLSCRETIRLALQRIQQVRLQSCWSEDGFRYPPEWTFFGDPDYAGGISLDRGFKIQIQTTPEQAWQPISRIGGDTGWYFADALWRLRGVIDRWIGGIGFRKGRRNSSIFRPGDSVDFWRVLDVKAPYYLLLKAEMTFPGDALLEFHVLPVGKHHVELQMISRYHPHGLFGFIYWFALYPAHEWIFRGLLKAIAKASEDPVLSKVSAFHP